MRRYSLSAAFGITSDQDDDGNQASGNTSKPKQQKSKSAQAQMPTTNQKEELTKAIELLTSVAVENGKSEEYKDKITKLKNVNINELNAEQVARTHKSITNWIKEIEQ
jgi:hypothetical protein